MDSEKPFLNIDQKASYHAIDDLIQEGRPTKAYYTLLIISSVIISAGLLVPNSAILIGGMLVTPVLNPVLLIALGIVATRPRLIRRSFFLVLNSFIIIFIISFLSGLLFSVPEISGFYKESLFDNSMRAAFLYFLVAFCSGAAATFSWVRKEVANVLPGISIAVSLVPPVSMVGIWLSMGQLELMRFFLMVFLFNMFGIIMGGLIIFSLLRFYTAGKHISEKIDEIIVEEAGYKTNTEIK